MRATLDILIRSLSVGTGLITALAVLSAIVLLATPIEDPPGLEMWIFSPEHQLLYEPALEVRRDRGEDETNMRVIGIPALKRRMLSGFLGGLPTADLIEIERAIAGQVFIGPPGTEGFVDLTDMLETEGLREQINEPSFGPWSTGGRIFGLPHDVHPVMLGYRADLVEAAGIDVTRIETWEDYFREMRPLMADKNGDGLPDRYPLALWESYPDQLEVMLLQAGGGFFDEDERLSMASDINARTLATIISWGVGPDRVITDVEDFTAAGNALKLEGYAIGYFMPDWMCNIWRLQLPGLEGKVKVMPLPAWEPGGRRTSVWGGTMIGIPKTSQRQGESWELAKELYLSDTIARELYTRNDIVTPIKTYWDDPMFDEPDDFFSGQAKGRMYVELAPKIPFRTSSPYSTIARDRFRDAAVRVGEWARGNGVTEYDRILERVGAELRDAESLVQRQIDRNVFADERADAAAAGAGQP